MKYFIHFLTFFRLLIGPLIFGLVLFTDHYGLALTLFMAASLSDYFDGLLARKYQLESVLGEVLDPIADKVLVLFLIVTLTLYFQSGFIGFFGAVILTRELWVAALRELNARNNKSHATKVTMLAKLKTTMQFIAFGGFLLGIYLNNTLIIFISNFFFFASVLMALQTSITYTQATFRD
jgi:cardiolipin synthase